MSRLYESFQTLSIPSAGGYTGMFLEDENYIVARDSNNHPVFLIRHPEESARRNLTYELEGLEALLEFSADVTLGEQMVHGNFALIRCSYNDEHSKQYFLELCGTLSFLIGLNPTVARIDEALNTLVRMFSLRISPPKRTIVGLLGELIFMDQHVDVPKCVRAWHASPRDVIDFKFPAHALEVKSTTGQERLHQLTFAQASGLPGKPLYFLSVKIIEEASGLSGSELVRRLMGRCGDDLEAAMQLWEMVGDTLGSSFQHFMDYCFSHESAVGSAQYYNSRDVPAIRGDLPGGVSRVTFVSDFSIVPTVEDVVVQDLLGLV